MAEPHGDAITVIVLTYNSAASIERTIRSARRLSADVRVVDSFSTDDTVAICERLGCEVVSHAFTTYAEQRNWAIDRCATAAWQLHLDADEELTPALVMAIRAIDLAATPHAGFMMRRRLVFLGRLLQHGGIAVTWHCRLFRSGAGRCEDRLYDQHFVCAGEIGTIAADMLDHQEQSLDQLASRLTVVDAKQEVRADVGGRSLVHHPELNVIELESDARGRAIATHARVPPGDPDSGAPGKGTCATRAWSPDRRRRG